VNQFSANMGIPGVLNSLTKACVRVRVCGVCSALAACLESPYNYSARAAPVKAPRAIGNWQLAMWLVSGAATAAPIPPGED